MAHPSAFCRAIGLGVSAWEGNGMADLRTTKLDLHAFIDGWLAAEQRREVAAYLDADPAAAERADAYVHQRDALALLGRCWTVRTGGTAYCHKPASRKSWLPREKSAGAEVLAFQQVSASQNTR